MHDIEKPTPQQIIGDLERSSERFETPSADGVMVWRAWGAGPPLLLLHGAHGDWTHWIRNIPRLSAHRRLLVPDLPGCGESGPPHDRNTGLGPARVIADGLRRLHIPAPLDLVGFSMGAVIAAHLAACAPDLVRRLVMIGAGGLGTEHGHMDIRPTSGLSAEARLAVQRHNLLQLMLHNDASADDLALYIQSARIRRGTINPKDLIIPDKLLLVLPQVRAQVDLIWGEFDRPHPDPEFQARALRRLKPDATLRIVHGAGHWAIYEGADEFNDHLEELLDEPLRRQRSRGTEAG